MWCFLISLSWGGGEGRSGGEMWMGRRVQVGTREWMGGEESEEGEVDGEGREGVREYREAKGVEDGRGRK